MSLHQVAALVLAVVGPLAFALEVQLALGRLWSFGAPAFLLLALRAAVTVLGLIAGRRLWQDATDGWRLVRLWAVASSVALALTYATPYFPSNRTPPEKRGWFYAWLAIYAVWAIVATWAGTRRQQDYTDKITSHR